MLDIPIYDTLIPKPVQSYWLCLQSQHWCRTKDNLTERNQWMKRKDCTQEKYWLLDSFNIYDIQWGIYVFHSMFTLHQKLQQLELVFSWICMGFLFFSLIWGVGEGVCLGVCVGGGGAQIPPNLQCLIWNSDHCKITCNPTPFAKLR